HVPDRHRCVDALARRSNPLAVGADRHGPDFTGRLAQGERFLTLVPLPGGRVPDADGLVRAARGEAQAVRAKRDTLGHRGVSAEVEHLPAGRRLPNTHRLVLADRSEAPAIGVGATGDAEDESVVPLEGEEALAGTRVPRDQAPVEAGRDQAPTVRA